MILAHLLFRLLHVIRVLPLSLLLIDNIQEENGLFFFFFFKDIVAVALWWIGKRTDCHELIAICGKSGNPVEIMAFSWFSVEVHDEKHVKEDVRALDYRAAFSSHCITILAEQLAIDEKEEDTEEN